MEISYPYLNKILNEFGIVGEFDFTIVRLIDGETDILVKCTMFNEDLLVRFYQDKFTTDRGLQIQGELCNILIINGCPVPRRLRTSEGCYYLPLCKKISRLLVTVEHWLPGNELIDHNLSKQLIQQLGRLLGKMHFVSERYNLHFPYGTYWGMFGGNFSDEPGVYDDIEVESNNLRKALDKMELNEEIVNEVFDTFSKRRAELKELWGQLPKGAVQGDLSPNNILITPDGKLQSLIDFNIAGEEVFINHLVGEGIFLAYEIMGEEQDECFNEFLSSYSEERPLSDIEKKALPLIVQVVRPFRFRRIQKIVQLIDMGECYQVENELKMILQLLNKERGFALCPFK